MTSQSIPIETLIPILAVFFLSIWAISKSYEIKSLRKDVEHLRKECQELRIELYKKKGT